MNDVMDLKDIIDVDDNDTDTEMKEFTIEDMGDLVVDKLSDIEEDEMILNDRLSLDISRQEKIDDLTEYKEQLLEYQDAMQRRQDIEDLYALKDELLKLRDIDDDSEDEQKVHKLR